MGIMEFALGVGISLGSLILAKTVVLLPIRMPVEFIGARLWTPCVSLSGVHFWPCQCCAHVRPLPLFSPRLCICHEAVSLRHRQLSLCLFRTLESLQRCP